MAYTDTLNTIFELAKLSKKLEKAGIESSYNKYITNETKNTLRVLKEMEKLAEDIGLITVAEDGKIEKNQNDAAMKDNLGKFANRWDNSKALVMESANSISEQLEALQNASDKEMKDPQWRALYRYCMAMNSVCAVVKSTAQREKLEEIENAAAIIENQKKEADEEYRKIKEEAEKSDFKYNIDTIEEDVEKHRDGRAEKVKKLEQLEEKRREAEAVKNAAVAVFNNYYTLINIPEKNEEEKNQLKEILNLLEDEKINSLEQLMETFETWVSQGQYENSSIEKFKKWDKVASLLARFNRKYGNYEYSLGDIIDEAEGKLLDADGEDILQEMTELMGVEAGDIKNADISSIKEILQEKIEEFEHNVNEEVRIAEYNESTVSVKLFYDIRYRMKEKHKILEGAEQSQTEQEQIAKADKILGVEFKKEDGREKRIEAIKFMLLTKEEQQKVYKDVSEEYNEKKSAYDKAWFEHNKLENEIAKNDKYILDANKHIIAKKEYNIKYKEYNEQIKKIKNITDAEARNRVKENIIKHADFIYEQKDFKKGSHKNSKEFNAVVDSLEVLSRWEDKEFRKELKNKEGAPKTIDEALENLEKASKDYLKAKKAQLRLSPSVLRTTRLDYVNGIVEFVNKSKLNRTLSKIDDVTVTNRIVRTVNKTRDVIAGNKPIELEKEKIKVEPVEKEEISIGDK